MEIPQRPRQWRYFSPANAPRTDGSIDLHVQQIDGGQVSTAVVRSLRSGDTVKLGAAVGERLTLRADDPSDLLLVAGGTGYAPIRAVLQELARRPVQPRTQVFVGGRVREDLYDLDGLRALSYRHPWLDVMPVVEQGGPDADRDAPLEQGTLADVVTGYGAWADRDVLVSGSPAMIRATVARMLVAGTPLDRIRYDPFTTEAP